MDADLLQQEAQLKTKELGSKEEKWPGALAKGRTDREGTKKDRDL